MPRSRDGYACANSTISPSSPAIGSGGNDGQGSCLYESWYGDNSFSIEDFATETMAFSREDEFPGVCIGCSHDNEGTFYGSAGILGLGAGSLSFVSQVSARSLSYCLVDRDSVAASTLLIGSGPGDRPEITAPLFRSGVAIPYYYVELTGISVGGKMLDAPLSMFAVNQSNWSSGGPVERALVIVAAPDAHAGKLGLPAEGHRLRGKISNRD